MSHSPLLTHFKKIQLGSRLTNETAFTGTMATFYDLRGSIGQAGAIDYSRMTGGTGAKYSDHEKGVNMINFVADVVNVARRTLLPHEFELFKVTYLDVVDPLNDVPNEMIASLQNVLGKRFRENNLYPMARYASR